MLLAGMALGTAWAIRGQFGHEQGAAWAGAIGSLSVLILAKRKDWISKGLIATFAGAAGWGLGGMIATGYWSVTEDLMIFTRHIIVLLPYF